MASVHPGQSTAVLRNFDAYVGGYAGCSFRLKLEEGRLMYSHASHGFKWEPAVGVSPTEADWEKFWATVQEFDIWGWHEKYRPEHSICDGTNWFFRAALDDLSVDSSGDNAAPLAFRQWCEAVSALAGGLRFR